MQKTTQEVKYTESQEIKFEFSEGEEQTTLARSASSELNTRRSRNRGNAGSSGFAVQLLRWVSYVVLIIAGLALGRWLSAGMQNDTASASSASLLANETSLSAPGSIVTSSGFVCPAPQSGMQMVSKELNMLVWTEYLPNEWFECFEAIYGLKIKRTEFSSNEEMLTLLADSANYFDLIQPSDQVTEILIRQGKLKKLDKALLSILGNFNPGFLNPVFDPGNEYTLPYQTGSIGLAVNSERVENLPLAWADLWKPEYAGHILMMEEPNDVIGMTLLAMGYPLNSTDPAYLNAIKPRLRELIAATKKFNSDSQSSDLLSGEIALGQFWNGEAALAQRENSAIRYVYPSEGAILWQDNYALWNDAQHIDAAYAWINYTMQGDLFWMMLRDFPYNNPNQAALEFARLNYPQLYEEYMNSETTNVPTQVMLSGHWLIDLGESQSLYDQLWAEVNRTQ